MSTFTQIHYHIVFSTKNREPVLRADGREELFRYIWGIIRNKNILNSRLFDPSRVEFICAPVTLGCTRGYSHSCPSGTLRHQGGFRTCERNPKPDCEENTPSVNLFGTAAARADGARRLRRFRAAMTRGSCGKAWKLRTLKRPQGRAPEQILAVAALDTYANYSEVRASNVGFLSAFDIRPSELSREIPRRQAR